MELILKNGLENIYFGQSIEDAIEVFGIPDREYHNTDDENEFILEWNAFKLRLTFYENENRKLGYIRTANPAAHLDGIEIIDKDIETVKKNFNIEETMDWEVESFDFFQTHLNVKYWLVLNVEYNRITDIELGVPLLNENEFEWPEL